MSVVRSVREQIEARLSELDTEASQLRKLLDVIDNDSEPATKQLEIRQIANGESKQDQIKQLLSEGMKPKEVAQKLECHVNYVYGVRRSMSES